MHVDDMAAACYFLMKKYNEAGHVNVGTGQELSIADLASLIGEIVNYEGEIVYDSSKPDGTPRKLLDVSKLLSMGWQPSISLQEGLSKTIQEAGQLIFD